MKGLPMSRPVYIIAYNILAAWTNVSPQAKPYLTAMTRIDKVTDKYWGDDASDVILYFLYNAASFRGPDAKALKSELKALLT